MLDKAKLLAKKFEELTDQLSDPEVLADSSTLERVARERSRLEPIARATTEVLRLQKEIADARASFDDEDLGELAREEVSTLEPQLVRATEARRHQIAQRFSRAI